MEPFSTGSPNEWKEELEKHQGQILDVRSSIEFEDSFILGAKNLDSLSADYEKNLDALNKDKPYFLYCRTGGRSGTVMAKMKEKGFKRVYNLEGGIMQWEFKGNEVEYGDDF